MCTYDTWRGAGRVRIEGHTIYTGIYAIRSCMCIASVYICGIYNTIVLYATALWAYTTYHIYAHAAVYAYMQCGVYIYVYSQRGAEGGAEGTME